MCRGRGERGAHTREPAPHPRPSAGEKIKTWQRKGRREAGQVEKGQRARGEVAGVGGGQENPGAGGGHPIRSKPNQNFKPYLRCLTSGEPDLGKGRERKKEREKQKKKKKERKGERNKENTSHQNQPERGEKKAFLPQFKNPF